MPRGHPTAVEGTVRSNQGFARPRANARMTLEAGVSSPLSVREVLALPVVIDVVTAARALGIGRTRAYALARRDAFPVRVLRVGTSVKVLTADLWKVLGLDVPAVDPRGTATEDAA